MNQFAQRVTHLEPEGAYAVLSRAQQLEAQGKNIIHFEIGQPDFDTFPHISLAGIRAISEGKTRYNPPAGLPELRAAIASTAGQRHGIPIDPAQVVIGPGAKPGLFFPTLALVNPGDEVIFPDPGFPTYPAMIDIAGGIPIPVPLLEENHFSLDLETFDRLINPRTKLIILNSPANPTGGVIPIQDLIHIAEMAQKYHCWVMSDEIYARLTYNNPQVPSIISLPHVTEQTILVDGFSKTYAMTGWRLGYAIMPTKLAQRVELLMTHSIGCTATFTQVAGIQALLGDQSMVDEVAEEYQRRRDRVVTGLNAIPGVGCQIPQGAFYAFPNIKALGIPSRKLAQQLLDEAGVAVLPGDDFGKNGEGYLRLCYAVSMDEIDEGLKRISEFVGKLKNK
jgi:aspartate/methionine/tyrosine aminotransferase